MGPRTLSGLSRDAIKYLHKIWQLDTVMRNEKSSQNINHNPGGLQAASRSITVCLCVDTAPVVLWRRVFLPSPRLSLEVGIRTNVKTDLDMIRLSFNHYRVLLALRWNYITVVKPGFHHGGAVVCHSKPRKAGNEQAEDCSNDVTQMSRVQISGLKMRVQIRAAVHPVTPPHSPPPPPSNHPSLGHNHRTLKAEHRHTPDPPPPSRHAPHPPTPSNISTILTHRLSDLPPRRYTFLFQARLRPPKVASAYASRRYKCILQIQRVTELC
ncbi:unnamed protein product [Pleuronectes platessa]|uniref:Uncharacterized protein n=1 Tax=Pleuronectes platessa TaxID=8262 RepID=A0A9N7YXF8_PLEPL|nr:unnamed protein product [Pleuronectes platessa]